MFNWFWKLFRKKPKTLVLLCIRQCDTFWWPPHLDEKVSGYCDECGGAIFYEKKNAFFPRKICNRCG
jgi:hypothetical protein